MDGDSELFTIDIETAAFKKALVDSTRRVAELKDEIKNLKKEEGDNVEAITDLTIALKAEQKEVQKNQKLFINLTSARNDQTGSIDQLGAELAATTTAWNKLSESERESTAAGQALTKQKTALTEKLKEERAATGDTRMNVGNYKNDVLEALEASDSFGGGLGELKDKTEETGTAFKVLSANPLGLFLSGLVAIFSGLFAAFSKTESGAADLEKVTAVLSAVFDTLVGIVGALAVDLVSVFSEPKEAAKDFGDTLESFVLSKLEAISLIGAKLKTAFLALLDGEFTKALDAAGEAGAEFIDEFTVIGLVKSGVDAVSDSLDGMNEKINASVAAGLKLVRLQAELTKGTVEFTTKNAATLAQLAEQIAFRDADTESLRRRIEVGKAAVLSEAKDVEERRKLAEAEKAIIDAQLQQAIANGAERSELLLAQASAGAVLIGIRAEEKKLEKGLSDGQLALALVEQDLAEQRLDVFLASAETEKGIREKQLTDDKRSIESKREVLASIKALTDEAFSEEIKVLEARTKKELGIRALLDAESAVQVQRRLEELDASEAITLRILEVYNERKSVLSDLNEAEKTLNDERTERAKAAAELDYKNNVEAAADNVFARLALEKEGLVLREAQEIEAAEKIGASTKAIEQKYATARKRINDVLFDSYLSTAASTLQNLMTIFGEQSAAGKALAVAQTTIDTYQSATAAYKSVVGIPVVGPGLAPVAAGVAVAAGITNVNKILSVDSGLPGDSGGGSAPSGAATGATGALPTALDPSLGQGVVSRGTEDITSGIPVTEIVNNVDSTTAAQKKSAESRQVANV